MAFDQQVFDYLAPDLSPYHLRSVNLVWALEQSSTKRHVEATIAQLLSNPDPTIAQRHFDAFGVLWRLTGRPVSTRGMCRGSHLI